MVHGKETSVNPDPRMCEGKVRDSFVKGKKKGREKTTRMEAHKKHKQEKEDMRGKSGTLESNR